MNDNIEMNEKNNIYAQIGALNKGSMIATSELSTTISGMQDSINAKQDISALASDVSSIVLSSTPNWVFSPKSVRIENTDKQLVVIHDPDGEYRIYAENSQYPSGISIDEGETFAFPMATDDGDVVVTATWHPSNALGLALADDVPTKTSELSNDSGFITQHQQLSAKYSQNPEFSKWEFSGMPDGYEVYSLYYIAGAGLNRWDFEMVDNEEGATYSAYLNGLSTDTSLHFSPSTWDGIQFDVVATRTRLDVVGYRLGDQAPILQSDNEVKLNDYFSSWHYQWPEDAMSSGFDAEYSDGIWTFTNTENGIRVQGAKDATMLTFDAIDVGTGVYTVTATRTLLGYAIGPQIDKPLQPAGVYALSNDLSSYLDKAAGGEVSASVSVSGVVSSSNDIIAHDHGLVGKDVDFSAGGLENFAVGHDHKFYGKESFAVHDGNIIGAKGIYWKAIDTTAKKIYLSKVQHCIPAGTQLTAVDPIILAIGEIVTATGWSLDRNADVPYIGDKASATGDAAGLFTAEPDIGLDVAAGTVITIKNYDHWMAYTRCLKVVSVEQGSIINYDYCDQNTILQQYPEYFLRTMFRRNESTNASKSPWDSHYVVYFPDKPDVTCNKVALVGATSFGCTALGDGNYVGGYNTFAAGVRNKAPGGHSCAIGYENNLSGDSSFAIGNGNNIYGLERAMAFGFGLDANNDREIAVGHFNKSTQGTSKSDPQATVFSIGNGTGMASAQRANALEIKYNNDVHFENTQLSGFYIGQDNFAQCILNAISSMSNDQLVMLKNMLGIS